MPVVNAPYEAPWYARNAYWMFIWANMLRRISRVEYDGHLTVGNKPVDYFDVAWKRTKESGKAHRAALIAPGLEGGDNAKYTRGMVRALNEEGFDAFVWVYRDTGTEPTHVRRSYHGADTDGLAKAVASVAAEYDHVSLVGFSLGASLIAKYLSEPVIDASVDNAVLFSPPIDLAATTTLWSSNRILKPVMKRFALRSMKEKAISKVDDGTLTWDEAHAYDKVTTIDGADHFINTEFNDFPSASKYWDGATSKYMLHSITVPTLIVSAKDDPLITVESYPLEDALGDNVLFERSTNGSHISFVPKGWPKHRYWSEKRAVQFLVP